MPLLPLLKYWQYGVILVLATTAAAYAHLYHGQQQKVAQILADDRAALAQAKIDADKETSRLKGIADAAEKQRATESAELFSYLHLNPLHGGLCISESHRDARVPDASPADSGHAGPSAAAADLQPVPARDPEASRRADPDIRHLLDVLAGRADEVSSTLREFQAR